MNINENIREDFDLLQYDLWCADQRAAARLPFEPYVPGSDPWDTLADVPAPF